MLAGVPAVSRKLGAQLINYGKSTLDLQVGQEQEESNYWKGAL